MLSKSYLFKLPDFLSLHVSRTFLNTCARANALCLIMSYLLGICSQKRRYKYIEIYLLTANKFIKNILRVKSLYRDNTYCFRVD